MLGQEGMNPQKSYDIAILAIAKREKTKGGLGGFCNLATCRTRPALFLQRTSGKYYCRFCSTQIERFRSQFKKETSMLQVLSTHDYKSLCAMEQAILNANKNQY